MAHDRLLTENEKGRVDVFRYTRLRIRKIAQRLSSFSRVIQNYANSPDNYGTKIVLDI